MHDANDDQQAFLVELATKYAKDDMHGSITPIMIDALLAEIENLRDSINTGDDALSAMLGEINKLRDMQE